ncbi:hypothetical protein [Hyalangium rubrum]|uniref:Lipoprotein n=1 Tax=Hyalangium rubrum TaxID=3103134 RepID=A0ABU5H4B6_9BACT|nr:hypothetical protein [Hyalangium sp. s54d21]MDY7228323.1 hypothetical protein [Hyalangium sp. s54d21]
MNSSRVALCACVLLLLGGCPQEGAPDTPRGRVEGQVAGPGVLQGDAYVFLFAPGEGPPQGPAIPRYVTAVSSLRLEAGDSRYRFSEVLPGPYRLWGFLDANGDADLSVDVLAQPGAGDWSPEAGGEVEVAAGEAVEQELTLARRMRHGPPAFRVAGEGTDGGVVTLEDAPLSLVSLSVEADGLGLLRGEEARFFVRLRDGDGDGDGDDLNGDGVPELFPQFFLRFVPRPGQAVPRESDGGVSQVIVPLLINPLPFVSVLQGDVTREASAESLQLFVVPQAQVVSVAPDGGQALTPLGAIPVGEYQLWALSAEGAFWYVPNVLGDRDSEALRSQALRFRIVRSDSRDGGG